MAKRGRPKKKRNKVVGDWHDAYGAYLKKMEADSKSMYLMLVGHITLTTLILVTLMYLIFNDAA